MFDLLQICIKIRKPRIFKRLRALLRPFPMHFYHFPVMPDHNDLRPKLFSQTLTQLVKLIFDVKPCSLVNNNEQFQGEH